MSVLRASRGLYPTLKEAPKDAVTPSHALCLRAGLMRQVGAGLYELLPLGVRVLRRIERIVRRAMDDAGCQEVLLPALLPADYYKATGRYDTFGDVLLRLKDRKDADLVLGPTHEEIITDLAKRELKSYKSLPRILYQIQTKFRDEPRPRAGLLRCREFLMKDAYSFDGDMASAQASYALMREVYERIFTELGLDFRIVQADSGAMGGSLSAEFQVLAASGEDALLICGECNYAANAEVARTQPLSVEAPAQVPAPTKVPTPGAVSIPDAVKVLAEAAEGGMTAAQVLKALVYQSGDELVLAVVRGDDELNENKLARLLGTSEVRLASEAQVTGKVGAKPGSIGPVGFPGRVLVDERISVGVPFACGANETGVHLLNAVLGRDFEGEQHDLRLARAGDACPQCGGELRAQQGIEAGHIFLLGTHYSEKLGATVLDEAGKARHPVMGCYGIGVSRLIAATIEQNHDAAGITWPQAVAPFDALIVAIARDPKGAELAEHLAAELDEAGLDVLIDDRAERPGAKFKDADLVGVPLRAVIGDKGLAEGMVEVKGRRDAEATKVPVADAAAWLLDRARQS